MTTLLLVTSSLSVKTSLTLLRNTSLSISRWRTYASLRSPTASFPKPPTKPALLPAAPVAEASAIASALYDSICPCQSNFDACTCSAWNAFIAATSQRSSANSAATWSRSAWRACRRRSEALAFASASVRRERSLSSRSRVFAKRVDFCCCWSLASRGDRWLDVVAADDDAAPDCASEGGAGGGGVVAGEKACCGGTESDLSSRGTEAARRSLPRSSWRPSRSSPRPLP
mmetsp:Transcript_47720/g.133051  ORF Transcript_47720/g.133051 Transcript_47720/m.133051 type:complete len:229 (+) Transcript_47720:201-887(+)